MMQRLFAILFSAFLLTVGFSACSGDGCLETGSCTPLASFYKSGNTTTDTVKNLTVRGIGARGDSCILKNEKAVQVYLPLKAEATSCQFEFKGPFSVNTTKGNAIGDPEACQSKGEDPIKKSATKNSQNSYATGHITTKTDTVTLQYESTKKFVSNDCGVLYYFKVKSASCTTTNFLDSVVVVDSTLSNAGSTSLKLYFK